MVDLATLSPGHEAEARMRAALETVPDYTDVVTDPHLQAITSRGQFIGRDQLRAFHKQAYPEAQTSTNIVWEVPVILFKAKGWIAGEHQSIAATAMGLAIRPLVEVGLPPCADISYTYEHCEEANTMAVEVGSLIRFVNNGHGEMLRLDSYDDTRVQEYFQRLARFLSAKTAAETLKESFDGSMQAMDNFAAALLDPGSGPRRGWSIDFEQKVAYDFVRGGIVHLELTQQQLTPDVRTELLLERGDHA